VAQFPDIGPPQSGDGDLPRRIGQVVEATIAQPIESQVNGVTT